MHTPISVTMMILFLIEAGYFRFPQLLLVYFSIVLGLSNNDYVCWFFSSEIRPMLVPPRELVLVSLQGLIIVLQFRVSIGSNVPTLPCSAASQNIFLKCIKVTPFDNTRTLVCSSVKNLRLSCAWGIPNTKLKTSFASAELCPADTKSRCFPTVDGSEIIWAVIERRTTVHRYDQVHFQMMEIQAWDLLH